MRKAAWLRELASRQVWIDLGGFDFSGFRFRCIPGVYAAAARGERGMVAPCSALRRANRLPPANLQRLAPPIALAFYRSRHGSYICEALFRVK